MLCSYAFFGLARNGVNHGGTLPVRLQAPSYKACTAVPPVPPFLKSFFQKIYFAEKYYIEARFFEPSTANPVPCRLELQIMARAPRKQTLSYFLVEQPFIHNNPPWRIVVMRASCLLKVCLEHVLQVQSGNVVCSVLEKTGAQHQLYNDVFPSVGITEVGIFLMTGSILLADLRQHGAVHHSRVGRKADDVIDRHIASDYVWHTSADGGADKGLVIAQVQSFC